MSVKTWQLSDPEREVMNVLVNKTRRTWTQLDNYYEKPPSKLISRIEPLANKMMDAAERYREMTGDWWDGELDDAEMREYQAVRSLAHVWDESFAETYTNLVADYNDIYGDD